MADAGLPDSILPPEPVLAEALPRRGTAPLQLEFFDLATRRTVG